jgi:SAM-dependent methyltransferase
MEFWESIAIGHRDHVLCNPLSVAKVDELIELLGVLDGGRLADIACGKGEFLCRAVQRWNARGVGVDLSPYSVEDARANVRERGLESRIDVVEANGAEWKPEDPPYDVVSCLGASWIWNGHAGTLRALADLTRPGGRIVVGEPFWIREPSPEHLEAAGHTRDEFGTHHSNVETGLEAGLVFHHAIVSSVDDWDRYEGLQWNATESWAREHPEHPAAPKLLEKSHGYRDSYLRWGRDELGWAVYLFSKP